MTEHQLPLFILIAFLGGCFAGAWARKSSLAAGILLITAIGLDIVGWAVYGFTVNWQPSWGIKNIVGGLLYNGIGMVPYATSPAAVGFCLTLFVVRRLFVNQSMVLGRNAPNKSLDASGGSVFRN